VFLGADNSNLNVYTGDVNIGGDLTFTINDGDNHSIYSISDAVIIGRDLNIINGEDTNGRGITYVAYENLAVGRDFTLSSGDAAGAYAVLDANSNATFTGAASMSAGVLGDATFNFFGSTVRFNSGLTMSDNAGGGKSTLVMYGTADQNVYGTIDGGADGEGHILIYTDGGRAIFNGAIGGAHSISDFILDDGASGVDMSAVLKKDISTADGIFLGTGGGMLNTLTFNTSGGDIDVNFTIDGNAGSASKVVITGGNAVTATENWGSSDAITNITLTGSGTALNLDGIDLTATGVTLGSGTTVNVLSTVIGNFDIDGASDGVGTLNLYDDLILVTGNIGDTHKLQKVLIDTNTLSLAQGDLNATTTVLKGTGTVEYYAGDSNFLTNFVAYADGDGTIRSNPNGGATSIFTGNIGTSSASIGTFEFLDNVAVDHAQFNGNVYVNQILMGTDDTLDFFGSGTQVVSGTIDGVAGGGESINVGVGNANHVVKFLGEIGDSNAIDLIYVDPNSTAQFMQDVTLTGSMASDGTTSLAAGKTISANSISGNGTYVIGVKDAGTLGTLETADIGVLNSAGNINLGSADVQFNVTGGVAEGTLLSAFTGGGVATDAVSVTDNSLLYSFALTANGSNFDLDVTKAAISSVGVDSGNTGVGEVLDSLSSTSDTSLGQVISNLAIASTVGELNDMLDATKPSVDSGSVQTSLDVADQHNLMAQNRVKGLRHGETGASSGDVTDGLKAWFQGFVRGSEQDARKGADGYSADSHGFSIGVDSDRIAKDATVGIALGYADSHIKSDNVNTTKSDMNSYNISVYGDY
jgi:hypothetical protein